MTFLVVPPKDRLAHDYIEMVKIHVILIFFCHSNVIHDFLIGFIMLQMDSNFKVFKTKVVFIEKIFSMAY